MHSQMVFDAVARGYSDLAQAGNSEIIDYFANIDADAYMGHVNNIKGILFEQEVAAALNQQGMNTFVFDEVNHPIADLFILENNEVALELQLKATDSVQYINDTLALNSDVPIIATTEVAAKIDSAMVIDSGVANAELADMISNTLNIGVDGAADIGINTALSALAEQATSDIATEFVADTIVSESASYVAGAAVNEGVAELIGESFLPVPISKIGLVASVLTFLLF